MATMHKQMVSFTRPQIEQLKAEARNLGISVSDLVRRAVDEWRENHAEHHVHSRREVDHHDA